MNKTEKKLIPELRFPEFVKDGEWEENIVSQVAEYENGKAHEQDIAEKGKYVVVNSKFISTDGEVRKYSNAANCLAKKNEILMVLSDVPNGRAIAKCFYVDKNDFYTVNQRICKLTPVNADGKLLFYLLNRNQFFLAFDDGVKQTNLRNADVLSCPIILPKNIKEQQKIASCLSSLDELIAAHNDKLQALKDHKKGLMQNLFPQKGQKVPNYRFPEFEKDGEWVEKKLEKTCELNPRVGELPDEFVYVDLESVSKGLLLKKNIIKKKDAPSRAQRLLQDNDVIYQMVRPYQKNNYYFIGSDGYNYVASTGYAQLRAFDSSIFLFQLIHTDRFVSSVLEKCTGSNYPAINSNALKQIEVQIPPSINEQQKIASCLSTLDELITAQAEKIEQLQQHKKGLMQGLFPKNVNV